MMAGLWRRTVFKMQSIYLRDRYIHLLGEEINELAGFAMTHGWRSKRAEEGRILREKIKEADKSREVVIEDAEFNSKASDCVFDLVRSTSSNNTKG
jgi:hypothetical protein